MKFGKIRNCGTALGWCGNFSLFGVDGLGWNPRHRLNSTGMILAAFKSIRLALSSSTRRRHFRSLRQYLSKLMLIRLNFAVKG